MYFLSDLDVSSPTISSSLGQLQFLLFQAAVLLIGDLDEDEDDASYDTAGNHHKHTCHDTRLTSDFVNIKLLGI